MTFPPTPHHIWPSRWFDRAACASQPRDLFFPQSRTHERRSTPVALDVCGQCPVRDACLSHALATPERFGIWGGTTAAQRGWDKYGRPQRNPYGRIP
ncbi:WhiB family transcriptional regulator [Streptomyces wedmorensis]